MIYHDNGQDSLSFFQEKVHLIGEIKSVTMTSETGVRYRFKVIGKVGEIWLSDEGVTPQIMEELGYPQGAVGSRDFQLGPPNRWKPNPPAISESAQEVFDFIKGYYAEWKIMPVAREITDGCDGISSTSVAHARLYALRDMGYILIYPYKARGIVLL